ncbi:MAG: hypothetical protein CVU46_10475 [Chloroflexi bacterium HGW-Chloroflexi-8]|nr:MAG: hypothetical protein CVU46_10475 [Chloroflexi bacterium HGW-Chloroflexi-8]
MPARKPKSLIKRHETAAEIQARIERESSVRPEKSLPINAPSRLRGHNVAKQTWRRLMKVFTEIEGEIVTRLDMDLLVDYCILAEQTEEIDSMRKMAFASWQLMAKVQEELTKLGKVDEAVLVASKSIEAVDAIIKLDGRVDRKRALMLQHRQSLYLTPRARAGVAPTKKEKEEIDPIDAFLNEVTDYVNGDQNK